MRLRSDGSFQSSNTPTWANVGLKEDFNLYRCMVTKVYYVDDPLNVTKNAQNPEIVYQCVILGGFKTGQTLTNCRLSSELGGTDNFSEIVLTPSSKPITNTRLADHDGDVVFVQFIQGHQGYPQIIATGNGIKDSSGTKKADGPRKVSQYNGLNETINNKGEWIVTRNGGSLDPASGRFKPGTSMDSQISLKKNQVIQKTSGGAELNLNAGKVALGAGGIELLQQISDQLQKIITFLNSADSTHQHIGNLGFLTAPPQNASDFTQLATDLGTIKGNIDGIKGAL